MASYRKYLVERTLTFIISMFFSITIVFLVPRLAPGDPIKTALEQVIVGGGSEIEKTVEEYKRMLGLDKDLATQYIFYIKELFRGNLGYSIMYFPTPVIDIIMRAIPWSIGLLTTTTILSWIIGTFIGAIAGWRGEGSRLFNILAFIALGLYVIPYYIFAVILAYLFGYIIRIFPLSGGYTPGLMPSLNLEFILDVIWHSTLPALSIILSSLGWWFLSMRSMIINVKGEDFILMAEAKGLRKNRILWKYAFRNAILPQVTGLALSLRNVVGGALLTEVIFAYPGVGYLIFTAITNMDYPLIQGAVLFLIFTTCFLNFAIDILYPLVDPRIRYGEE